MDEAEIRRKLRENSRKAQENWLKRSVPRSVPPPDDVLSADVVGVIRAPDPGLPEALECETSCPAYRCEV